MNFDYLIGIFTGLMIIFVILLTMPIFMCYTIYRTITLYFLSNMYQLWIKK